MPQILKSPLTETLNMIIKHQLLAHHVQKKIAPLYMIIGQDSYLLEDSLSTIKQAIKNNYECEEKIISIQEAEDWHTLRDEANSYSLFSDAVLLNVVFDKKSIEAVGKNVITEYLHAINSRCFIILRAPNSSAKQLQWLSSQESAVVVVSAPLTNEAMKNWIAMQLKKHSFDFDLQIPGLIYQYTQGNMLACAQVIEKIVLSSTPPCSLSTQQVQEQLSDQCDHNLFELIAACLLGQSDKAIQIIRHSAHDKTEPTLVLWMLCQEVRLLMQLIHLVDNNLTFDNACNQLKIWPSRLNLYKLCCKRFNTPSSLLQLHQYCYLIDERIKSNLNTQIWNNLEYIALSICLGKLIGESCSV